MKNRVPKSHKSPNCTKCLRLFTEGNHRACNGRRTECRECFNLRHRNWLANNRQHIREYKKSIYVPHPAPPTPPRTACKGCGVSFTVANRASGAYQAYCKPCYNAGARRYRMVHGDVIRAKECRNSKRRNAELKSKVFDGYGNACACCRETIVEFLTVDHVNNDGAEHRKAKGHRGSGKGFYKDIITAGFPATYQLLCMNCNYARRWGKKCPHELARLQSEVAAD